MEDTNALFPCESCKKEIPITQNKCPVCGVTLSTTYEHRLVRQARRKKGIGAPAIIVIFVILIVGYFTVFYERPNIKISESEYGRLWPFRMSSGSLICIQDGSRKAVFFMNESKRYAVNGAAMDMAKKKGGVWDKTQLFKRDSDGFYTIGDTEMFIRKGLKLCD